MRLSKRTGEVARVDEMLDEVGPKTSSTSPTSSSPWTSPPGVRPPRWLLPQKNENPVFYVQYANARIHSLARVAGEAGRHASVPLAGVDLAPLVHERELDVLRSLAELPEVLDMRSPRAGTPQGHHLGQGAGQGGCTGFYHDCRVMGEGVDLATAQRPAVAGRSVPAIGLDRSRLDLLGVSAPQANL